jgi:hypothetical protein
MSVSDTIDDAEISQWCRIFMQELVKRGQARVIKHEPLLRDEATNRKR